MVQFILIASLLLNVNYFLKVSTEDEACYECEAYEDFLEEWYKFDQQKQDEQSVDEFQYELPPDEDYEEPPTEEIKWLGKQGSNLRRRG